MLVGPNGHGFAYGYDGGHPILRAFFFIPIIRSRPTNLDNRPDFWNCPWVSGAGLSFVLAPSEASAPNSTATWKSSFLPTTRNSMLLTANSLGYRVITARGLIGRAEVGLADDLQERRAGPVQVDAAVGLARHFVVHALAGVLFQVGRG